MAVTVTGRVVTLTAVGDATPLLADVVGITFQGTGLTAGQNLIVKDANGSPLADYVIEAATDNADLWAGRTPMFVKGVGVPSGTVAGTWKVTIFLG